MLRKIFSLINCLCIWSLTGVTQNINFNHFAAEDGLSQVSILCSIEDSKGYLWFGTFDGLNRYDGYDFTIFKTDANNNQSIIDNFITVLHEDAHGNIWVGTAVGISRYSYKTNEFSAYQHNPEAPNSLSHNYITAIFEDTLTNDIWIGTKNGLNRYIEEKDHFEHHFQPNISNASFDYQTVIAINKDKNDRIWVGFEKNLYHIKDKQLTLFEPAKKEKGILTGQQIKLLYLDPQERFWVATKNGLYLFEEEQGDFQFKYQPNDAEISSYLSSNSNGFWVGTNKGIISFMDNDDLLFQNGINHTGKILGPVINTIIEDKNEIIWIGAGRGLTQYNPLTCQFNTNRTSTYTKKGLINNSIWAITEDNENNIILGGDGGLFKFNPETFVLKKWNFPIPMEEKIIIALTFKEETLWIGTRNHGLFQYNYKTNKINNYTANEYTPSSLGSNRIRSIKFDQEDRLWVGTDKGLFQFIPKQQKFKPFLFSSSDGDKANLNSIISIYPDELRNLWLATQGGLILFDTKTSEHILYKHDKNNKNSLSHDFVLSTHKSKNGTIWIGTSRGLNRWTPNTESFQSYGIKDGLPNDFIYNILEDSEGILWISTNKGLSKFNPKENSFTNFDVNDGLQSNEFNLDAAYKSKNGQFYFGGNKGLNYFIPETIKVNSTPPKINLERLDVLDVNHRELAQHNLFGKKKIDLTYKDYFFSIHFTALNFTNPNKNKYLYKLEGFDLNWKRAGQERIATYTNLKKGNYIFKVKVANNNGVWNEKGAELAIHISPPFWLTNWFAIFIVSLIIGSILAFIRIRTANIEKKNTQLEQLVSERTADLLEQKEKIARNELMFRSFYEQSPIGMAYIQGKDFNVIHQCNQYFAKILGYKAEELNQINADKIILKENYAKVAIQFNQALRNKKKFLFFNEVQLKHKDTTKKIVYCKSIMTFHWTRAQKLDYILWLLIDETEEVHARQKLKHAETQLMQANKMASLGQLTAGIAHEINNPVNFIYSGVNALKKNMDLLLKINAKYDKLKTAADFEEQKQAIAQQKKRIGYDLILEDINGLIESIRNGSVRTEKIVKGLQAFSRKDVNQIQLTDIHQGLDATLELIKKEMEKNIIVEKYYDLSIKKIECFSSELNQVFLNILINSIHSFNNQAGLITIKTENADTHITIEIKDNGMGMPADIASRIFDPFFTTKEVGKGTGLGLSISYGIIQKHKGNIQVVSKLGEGTSFIISLPKRLSLSNGIKIN